MAQIDIAQPPAAESSGSPVDCKEAHFQALINGVIPPRSDYVSLCLVTSFSVITSISNSANSLRVLTDEPLQRLSNASSTSHALIPT